MTRRPGRPPSITPMPGTAPPALAGKLSDEHLLAQNLPFCAATGDSPAGAEFVHNQAELCALSQPMYVTQRHAAD